MQGKLLCILFLRFSCNEEGNKGRILNESGKRRIYCNILKHLLTMSNPSILNKREKTLATSYFHSNFQREKVNQIRCYKRLSK